MNDVKYPELPHPRGDLPQGGGWVAPTPFFTADQMRSYADATCALRGAQKESGWISVEERMPEEEQTVFCTGFIENNPANARWAAVAVHHAGSFSDVETGHDFYPPTHWKPLDLPTPEGEAK